MLISPKYFSVMSPVLASKVEPTITACASSFAFNDIPEILLHGKTFYKFKERDGCTRGDMNFFLYEVVEKLSAADLKAYKEWEAHSYRCNVEDINREIKKEEKRRDECESRIHQLRRDMANEEVNHTDRRCLIEKH